MAQGFESYFTIAEHYQGWAADGGYKTNIIYLDVDSDGLNINQQIRERDARMVNSRDLRSGWITNERLSPAGDLAIQPRPDDMLQLAMAHFQCGTWVHTASAAGIGTGTMVMAPVPATPNWTGSTWGTLDLSTGYVGGAKDIYPVTIDKMVANLSDRANYGNAFVFQSGIVDVLRFEQAFDADLIMTSSLKFYDMDTNKGSYAFSKTYVEAPQASGSYSSLPGFVDWQGTLTIYDASAGDTGWDIDRFAFSGNNRTIDRGRIGLKGYGKYPLQKYLAEGEFDLAVDSLHQFYLEGAGSVGAITMRWQYDTKNWVELYMGRVILRPSELNIPGGDSEQTMTWNYRAVGIQGTPSVILRIATNKIATAAFSPAYPSAVGVA